MYFAIIESVSDTSSLATVAYGQSISDITAWYADEVHECLELYGSEEYESEGENAESKCDELCELAENNALDADDLRGLITSAADVTVEIVEVFDSYADFTKGLSEYLSDKPKFKKIIPEANPENVEKECDRINSLLIKECI